MEQDRTEREGVLYVAGVGASAGSLEALRKFVAGIRFSNNLAYIVARRLSPRHVSLLSPLVAGETRIQFTEAIDGMPVEAGRIYFTPTNADVTVCGGRLRLLAVDGKGQRRPVDVLLHSLAGEYGNRAIAVVLSGTGADGAAGAMAVKAAGGTVVPQDRADAGRILRRALLRHATPAAVLIDSKLAIIQSHGDVRRFLALDSGAVQPPDLTLLLPKPAQGLIRSQLAEVSRGRRPEKRILRPGGEDAGNIAVSIFPAENSGPEQYFAVTFEDALDALPKEMAGLQVAALNAVANGIFITGGDGAILWVNSALTRITGFGEEEIVGQPEGVLLGGSRDAGQWEHIWAQVRSGRVWRGEAVKRHRDGHLFTVQQTVRPIAGPGGQISHAVVILDDNTARKQAEWNVLHMAQHDSLTGLPNRNLFHERLKQAMEWASRRDRRIALLLLDLDEFKDTNDTMGHLIGDALLEAVARRLEGKLPAPDTLGRLGGDEFAILVEDVSSRESLAEYAQRVLSAFREPFVLPEHTVNITASLGIAMYPDDGITVEDLLRGADIAMYKAKDSARNAYRFYDAETDKETADRVRMVRELRGAFHNGSLRVAFQPQVDLADGRVIAAEALIRWTHDSLGEVSPAHLIHIAEASGLIHALGDWVWNEVCRQIGQWRDQGLPVVPVAVNLSAMQLTGERTAGHLLDPLERHGVEARLLMVEITESALLQHSDRVRKTLYDLHAAGISLVLDDFGTGYSSLTYLRQYPVSALKVDVSFVHGVGTNASDEEIISAMLSLARALGIKVVAEGVETIGQVEFLKARACDAAQGYFFGRPMTPAEFAALLRTESGLGPLAKAGAAGE